MVSYSQKQKKETKEGNVEPLINTHSVDNFNQMKFPLVCECLFRSPSSVLPCQPTPPPPPSSSPSTGATTELHRDLQTTTTFSAATKSPTGENFLSTPRYFLPSTPTPPLPFLSLSPALSPFCTTSCHRHSRELSPFWRNHLLLQINFLPPKMKFETLHEGWKED